MTNVTFNLDEWHLVTVFYETVLFCLMICLFKLLLRAIFGRKYGAQKNKYYPYGRGLTHPHLEQSTFYVLHARIN